MMNIKLFLFVLILVCLVSPISIPIDALHISFTLQTLMLFMTAAIFGKRFGLMICLAYIILGAAGLPVFGNFTSGLDKLTGATSGFIWGFPLISFLLGWMCEKGDNNFFIYIVYFFIAHLLLLIPGFLVLMNAMEGVKLWQTFLGLLPGLFIKSITGGVLASYILMKMPAAYTVLKS